MTTELDVKEALKEVKDPELDMDIITLGLIYDVKIEKDTVFIKMTFTTPYCPYGPMLLKQIEDKVKTLGVEKVEIDLVLDPPWTPSEELKALMGL